MSAGLHRRQAGWDAVLQHFATRRELGETMRMHAGEVVAASREVVIQLVDGAAGSA